MRPWPMLILCSVMLAPAVAGAQQTVVSDVNVRCGRSTTDRLLVNKSADLVLDDGARRLIVKNKAHPLDVGYDDVQRIVFDVSEHMRGGGGGGLLGAAIASREVNEHWCYLEYKGPDGTAQPFMLKVSGESSANLIEKMKGLFDGKVEIASFAEAESTIDKETLKDAKSKYEVKVDKQNHPMPESRSDKALIVVVCPTLKADDAGKGAQFKFHVNDQVVAVNKEGTYSFVYVDPGEYLLVSQAENASGLRMTLEAGKDYYFMQNMFMGMMQPKTTLTRHTRELVMYEVNGSYHSEFAPK
jgi:hypothetical protein